MNDLSDPVKLVPYGMLEFVEWPDLRQMPAELVAPAARICAHLSIRRLAAMVLPHVFDLTVGQTEQVLSYLIHCNSIKSTGNAPVTTVSPTSNGDDAPKADSPTPMVATPSFFSNLWRKLARI